MGDWAGAGAGGRGPGQRCGGSVAPKGGRGARLNQCRRFCVIVVNGLVGARRGWVGGGLRDVSLVPGTARGGGPHPICRSGLRHRGLDPLGPPNERSLPRIGGAVSGPWIVTTDRRPSPHRRHDGVAPGTQCLDLLDDDDASRRAGGTLLGTRHHAFPFALSPRRVPLPHGRRRPRRGLLRLRAPSHVSADRGRSQRVPLRLGLRQGAALDHDGHQHGIGHPGTVRMEGVLQRCNCWVLNSVRSDQACLKRQDHSLHPVPKVELGQHMADV